MFALSDVIALFHFVPYARSQARDAVRLRFDDNVLYCAINGLQAATSLDIMKASVALLSVCTVGHMLVCQRFFTSCGPADDLRRRSLPR